ncbi:MAG: nuclear transport factor 2 family protein [Elusimicrobiaceae bacterium]|nr:nuclear transport factor 2 family protein [Elusimicrobiaceae bacterium]
MNNTSVKDYQDILATVQKYVDGCNEGKSEVMKPAFDAGAVMYSVNADGSVAAQGSINNLYAVVDQLGADKNGKVHMDVVDSTPTTAVVRVTIENWHGLSFVDHHSLVKMNGTWKIVAKIYHTVA